MLKEFQFSMYICNNKYKVICYNKYKILKFDVLISRKKYSFHIKKTTLHVCTFKNMILSNARDQRAIYRIGIKIIGE